MNELQELLGSVAAIPMPNIMPSSANHFPYHHDATFSHDGDTTTSLVLNGDAMTDGEGLDVAELEPRPIKPIAMKIVDSVPLSDFDKMLHHQDKVLLPFLDELLCYEVVNNDHDAVGLGASKINNATLHICDQTVMHNFGEQGAKRKSKDSVPSSNKKRKIISSEEQSSGCSASDEEEESEESPFRGYQSEQWFERYHELREYRERYGHTLVPHNWAENARLAHWIKRQRHQYRLKMDGSHSNLTTQRQMLLDKLGFVWDSHKASWEERFNDLCEYRRCNGHCNVPSTYTENNRLSSWVKFQRRQWKLFSSGKTTSLSEERINKLLSIGFVFDPRRQSS